MACFIILLLAAVFAHQIEAHEDSPLAVCQAYYAVNGIAAEGVREDMICCCNVRQNYFVCGISNGVISGKLQSCPEGKVFNKATPELEACVPASSQQNLTCENWIDIAEEKAAAAADMRRGITTEGTHGCIDCDIGACHKCLCQVAARKSSSGVATIIDPKNNHRNQYLVCQGKRITCHPCPKGLVWDCQKQICAYQGFCSQSIPVECNSVCGIRTPTPPKPVVVKPVVVKPVVVNDVYKKMATTKMVNTLVTVTTTAVTVTKDGVSYIKKFVTTTTSVCESTSSAFAGKISVPGGSGIPSLKDSEVCKSTKTDFKTVVSPKTVIKTTIVKDACKPDEPLPPVIVKSCEGSCPATATISVGPK